MDWGQHIYGISHKATKHLFPAQEPKSTKEVAYTMLVRPKLQYVQHRFGALTLKLRLTT